MMMCYAPFTPTLGDKHGEARWTRYSLALYHPSKCVKACDFDGVIADYDCAPFVNRVFVAGSFCGREIGYDRLSPLGYNGTNSSEKNLHRGNSSWRWSPDHCHYMRLTNGQPPHSRLLLGQLRLQWEQGDINIRTMETT